MKTTGIRDTHHKQNFTQVKSMTNAPSPPCQIAIRTRMRSCVTERSAGPLNSREHLFGRRSPEVLWSFSATAGRPGQDGILRALGTALGDAVREPDSIDQVELLLLSMADLRRHHVIVLEILSENPPRRADSDSFVHWHRELIVEKSGYSRDVVNICVTGLVNSGPIVRWIIPMVRAMRLAS